MEADTEPIEWKDFALGKVLACAAEKPGLDAGIFCCADDTTEPKYAPRRIFHRRQYHSLHAHW